MQQTKNTALLDVRNTTIAVEQGRAQVQAASKARELQQQTFDAEQKKYQLGASTVYNVILTQRDLITAQGTELRALANLAEAKANYERAARPHPRSQQRHHRGHQTRRRSSSDTLIPGTHKRPGRRHRAALQSAGQSQNVCRPALNSVSALDPSVLARSFLRHAFANMQARPD